jgi:integrase/recombinase XerC
MGQVRTPLSREEVARLLPFVSKGAAGTRNLAHFVVLWRAGLRVSESCSLAFSDWWREGEASVVRVTHPKGEGSYGLHRTIGLDGRATSAIQAWVGERGIAPGPLFITSKGGRVHPTYIRRKLAEWAIYAHIDRRVHPHVLRHTFAHELYHEGFNLLEIQKLLGHVSLETTQVYLGSIGATKAVAASQSREWRTG